jgi:transaldolase
MHEIKYLRWLSKSTSTFWWHDSADPDELKLSLSNGATGVTTNPCLIGTSLKTRPEIWNELISTIPVIYKEDEKAERVMEKITVVIASMLEPVYKQTNGEQGFVCAQVNPGKAAYTAEMIEMAKRLYQWAPNIAVKLPVTAAGLDALEECIALGMTITATVSFTVPQVIHIAKRYKKGVERARSSGIKPGKCFAVVMIGRIDDYIRDVALDMKAKVSENDIRKAGLAILKRAYYIFEEEKYEAVLLPAGMRGEYHSTELSGAKMIFSIHPKIQKMIADASPKLEERINIPVEKDVINRLMSIPEFVKAYDPDGMKAEDFITYGVVQRTLTQFIEAGWNLLK